VLQSVYTSSDLHPPAVKLGAPYPVTNLCAVNAADFCCTTVLISWLLPLIAIGPVLNVIPVLEVIVKSQEPPLAIVDMVNNPTLLHDMGYWGCGEDVPLI
jgi:hypothetical protein